MEYKGYTARVEFDQDAGVLFGEVEGLRDVVTFEAMDVREIEKAFRASVDDYLAMCEERKEDPEKPYSGKFLVRVDSKLHRDIAMAAARAGKSLNALTSELLKSWIDTSSKQLLQQGGRWIVYAESPPPANANASSQPVVGVQVQQSKPAPIVVAESSHELVAWQQPVRRTPGSLTPNTPGGSRTPQRHLRNTKAA